MAACSQQGLNRSAPENREHFLGGPYLHCEYEEFVCWAARRQRVAYMPPPLVLVLRVPHGAYFTCHYEGVSHAEWPKDCHEWAPTQTGGVICCPLNAVDLECRPPRPEGPSKRAKKL